MKKIVLLAATALYSITAIAQTSQGDMKKYLDAMHNHITSEKLFDYVKELSDPKYEGRLAGSAGMEKAANWATDYFKTWNLTPAGDKGGYIQQFPLSFTEQVGECGLKLHFPLDAKSKEKPYVTKTYQWADDWYGGGTSGNGEITAEVVYAGFGVTAPELGYDDYKGIDVKGKIVLIEGETPNRSNNPDTLRMWYKHTLHDIKLKNAVDHGAVGMLYKWVCGPNNGYDPNFVYVYVNTPVVDDLFAGTGKTYAETVKKIYDTKTPQSFATGKKATIKMTTRHTENGTGRNVVGMIKGSDPVLSEEYIVISGHLDHLGMVPYHIAGANDNNAATAVLMGVAEALAKSPIKPKRSVLFVHIDAEEAGLKGSEYFAASIPKEKVVAVLNLEQPGVGTRLRVGYGIEFPGLKKYFAQANNNYVHRELALNPNRHITRPRTDGAVFMKAGFPAVDIGAYGGRGYYHNPKDDWQTITPEILQDAAKMLFLTTIQMANDPKIDLTKE